MGTRAAPRFEGEICVRFLPDGKNVEIEKPFTFHDSGGRPWYVTEGRTSDGASIPRIAWPIVGGPYNGLHRDAALVHDEAYACCGVMVSPDGDLTKSHAFTRYDADRALLEGMVLRGVPLITRRLIYSAVRMFGGIAWRRNCRKAIGGGPWNG